jgi:hypothetical protein
MTDDQEPGSSLDLGEIKMHLKEFDQFLYQTLGRLKDMNVSNEEFIDLLRKADDQELLYDRYDINDIRKVPIHDRPMFFRYFMMYAFIKMIEQAGVLDMVEAAGFGTLVPNDTGKPWAALFGKLPKFYPGFLGVYQNCMWTRVIPKEGLRHVEREQTIYEPLITQLQLQGLPKTPPDGVRRHITTDEIVVVLDYAIKIYLNQLDDFKPYMIKRLVDMMGEDIDPAEVDIKQVTDLAVVQMIPMLYFILSATGLSDRIINGLADRRPILERAPGGPIDYRVTGAGQDILWIKKR